MKQLSEILSISQETKSESSEEIPSPTLTEPIKRKYNRISSQKRDRLLQKIFFEHKKIKSAAKELNINYSSAKTILHLYRKKAKKTGLNQISKTTKRCSYKLVNPLMMPNPNLQIVISQGGRQIPTVQQQQQQPVAPLLCQNYVKDNSIFQQNGGLEDSSTLSISAIKQEEKSTFSPCFSSEQFTMNAMGEQMHMLPMGGFNRFQPQLQSQPYCYSLFHNKQPVFC